MHAETPAAPRPAGAWLAVIYCWAVSALFGAVLLDVVYARAVRGALDPARAATVFSGASDFLLIVVALAALAALGAVGSSWPSRLARNLFLASAFLVVAEPLAPLVLGPLALEPGAGAWVRLVLSASASLLGLLGLDRLYLRT